MAKPSKKDQARRQREEAENKRRDKREGRKQRDRLLASRAAPPLGEWHGLVATSTEVVMKHLDALAVAKDRRYISIITDDSYCWSIVSPSPFCQDPHCPINHAEDAKRIVKHLSTISKGDVLINGPWKVPKGLSRCELVDFLEQLPSSLRIVIIDESPGSPFYGKGMEQ